VATEYDSFEVLLAWVTGYEDIYEFEENWAASAEGATIVEMSDSEWLQREFQYILRIEGGIQHKGKESTEAVADAFRDVYGEK
jgi:hypothetical protein